jgi:hypothetical protein
MENGPMVIDPLVHPVEEIEQSPVFLEQIRTHQFEECKVRV